MIHFLTHLLEKLGPVLVFALVFLESMGLPFPGETILLMAAAFAAAGKLSIVGVAVGSALGGFGGAVAGYWIGRSGVVAWVRRRGEAGKRVAAALSRAHDFFEGHGAFSLLLGRFIAVVRSYVFIAAGVARMSLTPFLAWTAAGAVLWSGLFATLGYEFGQNLPKLEHALGAAGLAAAGALGLAAVLALLIRWTWRNQERIWEATSSFWEARVRPLAKRYPRAWKFASARLSPVGYLGLHLTIGILVSILALWLFGGVLEDVVAGDPLTRFDERLAAELHARATPMGVQLFRGISLLGSPGTWSVLALVVLAVLLLRRERILAAGWVAAIMGGGVLDVALKVLVHRPRPVFPDPYALVPGWSFPSGHSMGSLVGYGMIAYFVVLRVRDPRARAAVIGVATALVALVGLSRMYLGVHYFSDVVGGFTAGIVWLSACITGLEVSRRRRDFHAAVKAGAEKS